MLQLDELMGGCNGGASSKPSQQYSCRTFTFTDDLKRYLNAWPSMFLFHASVGATP